MLGDNCNVCHQPKTSCGCNTQSSCDPCGEPKPNHCNNEECEDWLPLKCVFWKSDPIQGTPIGPNSTGTEIILYLIERLKQAEARLTEAGL